jgi:DNA gyrase/topoisomerase IV subunit A
MMNKTTISEYLDTDYKEYAKYVVENRAIPSVIDGLKPTQRKVVYVADRVWRNGSEKPYKVFQLTGRIAADAHYHHGDSSLNSAIIGMAQDFKNSMPLLDGIGQFGSLRSPEAGAPRYVSTRLHPNFRLLYKDFELLSPRMEEGSQIEPEYFLPIVPTVLLNGSSGIAVGFATNILNRKPEDLIECCLKELSGRKYEDPKPWIRGFSGTCEKVEDSDNSWIFRGVYTVKNTTTVEVSEIPPSATYEKYDNYLNSLEDERRIVSYDNNCKSNIDYTLKFNRSTLSELQKRGRLESFLKMEERQSENFTVLDENGKLKIFNNATEIIKYFVEFRLGYYQKRKDFLIRKITDELTVLSNKARFIKAIIDGKLKINNVPKAAIVSYLESNKFDQVNGSYTYLLSMPIHTLTKEKYEELLAQEAEKKSELEQVKKSDPGEMYKKDLQDLKKVLK